MEVSLTYQLHDHGEPQKLELSPADFFDPLEAGESFWDDAVERHLLLHEYLGVEPARVKWMVARVSDGGRTRLTRAQYLDGDNVLMQHTVDEHQGEEIILSTRLPTGESHTIRVLKPGDASWSVTANMLIHDASVDDQPSITDLCRGWTFEERKTFCQVGSEP